MRILPVKYWFPFIWLLFHLSASANGDTTTYETEVVIHTPTNSLQESIDFYSTLGYKVISDENPALVCNGQSVIEINPSRYARAGVKMYRKSWRNEVAQLKGLTELYPIEGGHILNDLNGCWIYLMDQEVDYSAHVGDSSFAVTGNFMGLSLESANMAKSLEIWQILGFSAIMGTVESGFLIIQNQEGFSVSLMKPLTCPHLFFNPSMTFFNGAKNLGIIEQIRKLNIPITEEITVFNKEGLVDNIIIRDPGGFGFFIFSD